MQKLILVILLCFAVVFAARYDNHIEYRDTRAIKTLKRFFVPQFEEIREYFEVKKYYTFIPFFFIYL